MGCIENVALGSVKNEWKQICNQIIVFGALQCYALYLNDFENIRNMEIQLFHDYDYYF